MPKEIAVRTTARTAAFMPGASPPLVSTAIFFAHIVNSSTFLLKIAKLKMQFSNLFHSFLIIPLFPDGFKRYFAFFESVFVFLRISYSFSATFPSPRSFFNAETSS